MSQKVSKEQMPAMIAELVNRQSNVQTLVLVKEFLNVVTVQGGGHVVNLARCLHWVDGVIKGEELRIGELKGVLPDKDAEIKMGPEEPEKPEPNGADISKPLVSQGAVELEKGEPVLGAV